VGPEPSLDVALIALESGDASFKLLDALSKNVLVLLNSYECVSDV